MKRYKIESYSRDVMPLFGHVGNVEYTDDLKEAKKIASKRVGIGDINIWIFDNNEPYMQYAHKV